MTPAHFRRPAALALVSFVLLMAWDVSGLDMALARLFGNGAGFPLRDHWFLSQVMHDGGRRLSWALVLLLCAAVAWPWGPLARLPLARRVQLPAGAVAATAAVVALKAFSGTSCPWDLSAFGGVARHLSHWGGWFARDGGGGHCFPAGHAASGFAFVGSYFALRRDLPRLARRCLVAALGLGLLFGLVQQARGAHFMSHTLWTAWLCGMTAWLTDPLFEPAAARVPVVGT